MTASELHAGGWRDWCLRPPLFTHVLVEAWRREWSEPEVLRLADLHPALNVAGLYWRPLRGPLLEPEVPR